MTSNHLPEKCHIVGSAAHGFAYSFSNEKGVGPTFRTKEEARVSAWNHLFALANERVKEIPVMEPITRPLRQLNPESWK